MGVLLSKKKHQELLSALNREDKKRYAYRLHIILLLDDGYSQRKIWELFFLDLSSSSINRWLQKYKEGEISLLIADDYENSTKRSKLSLETVSQFLKDLRRQPGSSKELVVVLDQARSHQSDLVKKTTKKLNITLFFLPAYNPNLNPIERYWKFFKKKVLYNRYYETFYEFQTACTSFFRFSRKYNKELHSLLTYNFHVYDSS